MVGRGAAAALLALVLSSLVLAPHPSLQIAGQPSQIKVFVCPPWIPADGGTYEAVFIQLLDEYGQPARATGNITVTLSSSNVDVCVVEEKAVLRAGETYAVVRVNTTLTPGYSTISASAQGLRGSSATLTTVGCMPKRVAVMPLPPTLPADGVRRGALIVQLQDSVGNPVRAPRGGVIVHLFTSNSSICGVDPYVEVREGETYAVACLTPRAAGYAVVTPAAAGLTPVEARVAVQEPSDKPFRLKIYVAPLRIPADGGVHPAAAVQLIDQQGRIARAQWDLNISLSSSNIEVCSVPESIIIKGGETYAVAAVRTMLKPGSALITAAAQDFQKDQVYVTTVGSVPSRLALYTALPVIPADGGVYRVLVLQVQDASGTPAAPSSDVEVAVSSSNRDCAAVNETAVIPRGCSTILLGVKTTPVAGSAQIQAQSAGFTPAQVYVSTRLIDLFSLWVNVSVNPRVAKSGESVEVAVSVSIEGMAPAERASVKLSSNVKVEFDKVVYVGGGVYKSSFKAPSVSAPTAITIKAEASLRGYTDGSGSAEVRVEPPVRYGALRIQVKAGGRPIQNATVISVSKPAMAPELSARTGEDGAVVFEGIPEGEYIFEVAAEGYPPKRVQARVRGGQEAMVAVDLSAADQASLITVAAAAAGAAGVVLFLIWKRRRERLIPLEPEGKKEGEKPPKEGGRGGGPLRR